MTFFKRFWKIATIDNGLMLGVVLFMFACLSLNLFIIGGNAYDDLPKATRMHMEDCAMAHREIGLDVYERRQDCLDVLPKRPTAAKTARP